MLYIFYSYMPNCIQATTSIESWRADFWLQPRPDPYIHLIYSQAIMPSAPASLVLGPMDSGLKSPWHEKTTLFWGLHFKPWVIEDGPHSPGPTFHAWSCFNQNIHSSLRIVRVEKNISQKHIKLCLSNKKTFHILEDALTFSGEEANVSIFFYIWSSCYQDDIGAQYTFSPVKRLKHEGFSSVVLKSISYT